MANNSTHEKKVTYSDQILAIARAELNIYNDFSEDYEKDEVTGKIMVPTRNDEVKVSNYDILNGVELTQSKTAYIELPVDQDYAVNELIDGYEADAVPDNIVAQRIESAGVSFGITKEKNAINALVANGTVNTDTTPVTNQNVYDKIAADVSNMKKRNMKVDKMRIAVNADVELALLTDTKFANSASTLGAELLREGVIGKINGVATKPNYLLPEGVEYVIFDKRFCQKYEVWKAETAVNPIQDGKHIKASALQGRQVGGIKVTNKLGVQIKKNTSSEIAPVSEDTTNDSNDTTEQN